MSFHSTFHISDKKIATLLNVAFAALSLQQRAEFEIPLLAATVDELDVLLDDIQGNQDIDSVVDESKLQYYCMFIGYPRSGHSLIGSLLDAHEEMCISHEMNIVKLMSIRELKKSDIFSMIIKNAKLFASLSNQWGQYQYHVKGQFQGQSKSLKVIGDKKGGATAQMLKQKPHLLDQLYQTVQLPLKVIHVVRNPFDNIATLFSKDLPNIANAIMFYQDLCEANQQNITRMNPNNIINIKHEDFLLDPVATLETLTQFLGVESSTEYYEECAAIVRNSPNRSRDQFNWTEPLKKKVLDIISRYDFLQGYSFEQ